jgi:hypothetical protein
MKFRIEKNGEVARDGSWMNTGDLVDLDLDDPNIKDAWVNHGYAKPEQLKVGESTLVHYMNDDEFVVIRTA